MQFSSCGSQSPFCVRDQRPVDTWSSRALLAACALSALPLAAQDVATRQDPFRVDGSAQLRYSAYRSQRSSFPANAVYLTAAPTAYVYGVAVPFEVSFSNVGVDFRQPFNRFSLRPRYRWAEAQLGWINPRYGEFTLAGITMLGAGLRLRPGRWDVAGSFGRLNRATTLDTLAGQLNPESFDRFGYALRVGYGTERARVSLTVLAAEDRPESLRFDEAVGRRQLLDVEPAANQAGSLEFAVPFGRTVTLETEAAVSVFTENLTLDGAGLDSSLADAGVPRWFADAVGANLSTDYYTALQTRLRYAGTGPRAPELYVSYRRVDPNYRSMGALFFQNDLAHVLVGGSLRPWRPLRLRASVGRQRDNLTGVKAATSVRVIGSARADFQHEGLALSLDYYNYANDQQPRLAQVGDSLRIASVNQSLSFSPAYTLQRERHVHVVASTLSRNVVRDFLGGLSADAAFRDLNTDVVTLTYSLSWLRTATTASVTGNYTSLGRGGEDPAEAGGYVSTGANVSLSQGFAAGKGNASANAGLFAQQFASDAQPGSRPLATLGLSGGYRLAERLRAHLSCQYSAGPATGRLAQTADRFRDVRVDTRLTYRL